MNDAPVASIPRPIVKENRPISRYYVGRMALMVGTRILHVAGAEEMGIPRA
jgi:hypothetical protein